MIEDVVDEIVNVLKANLEAELAALRAQPVKDFLIAEEDIPPARLPAVFILPQTTLEISTFPMHDEVHTIFLVALAQHVQQAELARQTWRLNRAMRRALTQNLPQAPQQFVIALKVIRHDYSPVQQMENSPEFSKSVQLQIEATERINEI